MEKQGVLTGILRFLGTVVLIDLGIFAAVGLVCWLGGWRTAYQYGGVLFWAGVAAIVIGLSSLMGGWGMTRNFTYLYGQSVSEQNIHERTRQAIKDEARSYWFLILMAAVGVVSIAVSTLIQTIFR
ncbi:MAG: hypothetical protein FJ014_15900 [Chloroflexi bacterium]|nr:hypothetical protein [Chloroflexota bacterium]